MNWLKINNQVWDVTVLSITENFNILYSENTGRTLAPGARMALDPLGTFYGHKITVAPKENNRAAFDSLFNFISQPRYDGIPIEAVHGQNNSIAYDAYVSSGERTVTRIDERTNAVYYDTMEINIIPMEAQVTPL